MVREGVRRTNELTIYQQSGLPAQPEELSRFIVVAQEKIKAVKAEIRAIQRLDMAKEVYDQKIEEQARLQELTLLAYQRMGEITRELPTSAGGRPSEKTLPASGKSLEKSKFQAIQDLGFSTSQVNRMEQMAAHPDVVEEVIAESQAGQTEATQTEVLRRIKEQDSKVIDLAAAKKKRYDADMEKISRDYANLKVFRKATNHLELFKITDEILDSVVDADTDLQDTISGLNEAIRLLSDIRGKLLAKGAKCGKANYYTGNQRSHL